MDLWVRWSIKQNQNWHWKIILIGPRSEKELDATVSHWFNWAEHRAKKEQNRTLFETVNPVRWPNLPCSSSAATSLPPSHRKVRMRMATASIHFCIISIVTAVTVVTIADQNIFMLLLSFPTPYVQFCLLLIQICGVIETAVKQKSCNFCATLPRKVISHFLGLDLQLS